MHTSNILNKFEIDLITSMPAFLSRLTRSITRTGSIKKKIVTRIL